MPYVPILRSAHRAASLGLAIPVAFLAAINMYQYRKSEAGRLPVPEVDIELLKQDRAHLRLEKNRHLSELMGVCLGMGTLPKFVSKPAKIEDPERCKLDYEIEKRFVEGKISHWEYHALKGVNIELYKLDIPLSSEAKDAILDALDEMYKHRGDYLKSPIQWMEWKIQTELKIANAFAKEGSMVGLAAHTVKGYLEASLCTISQLFHAFNQAHAEQVAAATEGHKHAGSEFKSVLSELRGKHEKEDPSLGPLE